VEVWEEEGGMVKKMGALVVQKGEDKVVILG